MAFISTFKRVEKKFVVPDNKRDLLMDEISNRLTHDAYAFGTIYSLYYDTPDRLLVRRSIQKPVYKEKLRLRSYAPPTQDSQVFVELKRKYKGTVYKRRESMSLSEAMMFVSGEAPPFRSQITDELTYFRDFYQTLEPASLIYYEREAFVVRDEPEVRITFDKNICACAPCFPADFAFATPLIDRGESVMEIKLAGAMPMWLSDALSKCEIFKSSFSKYGNAFLAQCQERVPIFSTQKLFDKENYICQAKFLQV